MRYVMKQKLWSLGSDYTVNDEGGQPRFFIDGKAWSFGDSLSFQDMAGNELARIEQKLLAWGPTYELYDGGGRLHAVVKEHLWTMFNYRFTVDVGADGPTPNDLEIQGNFTAHEYIFLRGNQPVAHVSEKWFTFADTYGVDVAADQDPVLILACTVIVDLCVNKHHRS